VENQSLNASIRKKEKYQTNNLNFCLKKSGEGGKKRANKIQGNR
jgi:hypothetical protein